MKNFEHIDLKNILGIQEDREAITHGGVFHSDDVFATALLKLAKPDIIIRRVMEVPENFTGLVYDIGFGAYDHHQTDKRVRENGIAYAAFGLLWEKLGPAMYGQEIADRLDESFVEEIDYTDNTGKKNLLSITISDFNPQWNEDTPIDVCFDEAVSFAMHILKRKIANEINAEKAHEYIADRLKESTDRCVVLEKAMPWKKALIGTDTEFVIYPSLRGGYMLQTVPKSESDNTPIVALPEQWRGKDRDTLRTLSGVDTITFCHAGGFLASAERLEDVWKMVRLARRERETALR